MSFDHGLNPGDTINNHQLMGIFRCSNSGGMRRSRWAKSLVIVSDHTKAIYEDRWQENVLHYTGMGLEGDQRIDAAQNKTIVESAINGVELFLFEVFESKKYVFIGQVYLADTPYQEDQLDKNSNLRKVWIFPLQISGDKDFSVPEETILNKQAKKQKEAKRLNIDELERRAKYSRKGVGSRLISTKTYERNVYVAEMAKRNANGVCQLCENPAPFSNQKGEPFLESHHIIWLSQGGEDTIDNTVALCPNCHRKMHTLNLNNDLKQLKIKAQTHMI